jgi:hypothetical protein
MHTSRAPSKSSFQYSSKIAGAIKSRLPKDIFQPAEPILPLNLIMTMSANAHKMVMKSKPPAHPLSGDRRSEGYTLRKTMNREPRSCKDNPLSERNFACSFLPALHQRKSFHPRQISIINLDNVFPVIHLKSPDFASHAGSLLTRGAPTLQLPRLYACDDHGYSQTNAFSPTLAIVARGNRPATRARRAVNLGITSSSILTLMRTGRSFGTDHGWLLCLCR